MYTCGCFTCDASGGPACTRFGAGLLLPTIFLNHSMVSTVMTAQLDILDNLDTQAEKTDIGKYQIF